MKYLYAIASILVLSLSASALNELDQRFNDAAASRKLPLMKECLDMGADIDAIGASGSALRRAIHSLLEDAGWDEKIDLGWDKYDLRRAQNAMDVLAFLLNNGAAVMDAVYVGNARKILAIVYRFYALDPAEIGHEGAVRFYENFMAAIDRNYISEIDSSRLKRRRLNL